MKITPKEVCAVVEFMVSSDKVQDLVWKRMDKNRLTKTDANYLLLLVEEIYTFVHLAGGCGNPHEDWRKKFEKLYFELKKDDLI